MAPVWLEGKASSILIMTDHRFPRLTLLGDTTQTDVDSGETELSSSFPRGDLLV
jgi:hypothetical protein